MALIVEQHHKHESNYLSKRASILGSMKFHKNGHQKLLLFNGSLFRKNLMLIMIVNLHEVSIHSAW